MSEESQRNHSQADGRTVRLYRAALSLQRMDYRTPEDQIPEHGVYFFFENGESVVLDGVPVDRIVRVGIDTSGSLRKRLWKHYNESGISIFKWHVCCATLAREDPGHPALRMERPYRKPELRSAVCRIMRDTFSFACIGVSSPDDRTRLESGLIALLAQHPLGCPSENWLGRHAVETYRPGKTWTSPPENVEIRASGLWNMQHTGGTPLEERDLELIERIASDASK